MTPKKRLQCILKSGANVFTKVYAEALYIAISNVFIFCKVASKFSSI